MGQSVENRPRAQIHLATPEAFRQIVPLLSVLSFLNGNIKIDKKIEHHSYPIQSFRCHLTHLEIIPTLQSSRMTSE